MSVTVTYLDKFSTFDTVGHVKADIHFDLCVLVCKFHNGHLKVGKTLFTECEKFNKLTHIYFKSFKF